MISLTLTFLNSLKFFHFKKNYNYNNHYFNPSKFFITVLTSGLSVESEWQHVCSGLKDSSQYFSRS